MPAPCSTRVPDRPWRTAGVVLALVVLPLGGCLAVAAGAGAGAAIAWTQRGASAVVGGSVDDVFARGERVFRQAGVRKTGESTERSGAERTLVGSDGDREVTLSLRRESAAATRAEVVARRSTVEWDKRYARDLLARLVEAR